ncbi:unnamed protein product [Discosporangium mesarthrocarpum]
MRRKPQVLQCKANTRVLKRGFGTLCYVRWNVCCVLQQHFQEYSLLQPIPYASPLLSTGQPGFAALCLPPVTACLNNPCLFVSFVSFPLPMSRLPAFPSIFSY